MLNGIMNRSGGGVAVTNGGQTAVGPGGEWCDLCKESRGLGMVIKGDL